jgi:phosphorylcholine metabolism protein LicD
VQAHRRKALQIAEKVRKKFLTNFAFFAKMAKFVRQLQTYYNTYKKHTNNVTCKSDAHNGGMILLIVNVVPPGC